MIAPMDTDTLSQSKGHCVHCEWELTVPLAERLRQMDQGQAPRL
jgi:hypothetical protein